MAALRGADDDDEDFDGIEVNGMQLTEGGTGMTKTKAANTYHHVRNLSEHETLSSSLYTRTFCTAIHQTLLHIAVIYSLIIVTYVAFIQTNSNCVCSDVQQFAEHVQTFEPTNDPSFSPTPVPSNKPWVEPSDYPTPSPTNKDTFSCGEHATIEYEDELLTFTVGAQEGIIVSLDVSKSYILINAIKAYDMNGILVNDALFDSDTQSIEMYAPLTANYGFKLYAEENGNTVNPRVRDKNFVPV